jgi:hypothetical protein
MPAWINVLVTIAMVLGGILLQALFISYTVGNAVGKYRERLEAGEAANIQRDIAQGEWNRRMETKVERLIEKIARFEGRMEATKRGG